MKNIWGAYLTLLLLLALACLIARAVAGVPAALGVAAAAFLALLLHHLRHIARLARWLRDPAPEKVPDGSGLWDGIFAELYRMLRRQRQSESKLTASLEEFQQAGAAMPDGMVILNATDRIEQSPLD